MKPQRPPHVSLPGAALPASVPRIGLGTWRLGESRGVRKAEVAAVRGALEMGYRLIDTAEMYGEGGAEEVVGQALREAFAAGGLARDDVFVVSKVYPHNANRRGLREACARSRERLGLDRIDLYLLHWPGQHPLAETLAGFEDVLARGWIRRFGVSNFDTDEMQALWDARAASIEGAACATNQVYYSLSRRGIEHDLLPWQRERRLPTMAYSPVDRGVLASQPRLAPLAQRLGLSPAQLGLAWVMRGDDVIAIPKAVQPAHQQENLAAASITLDTTTLAELDALFPPPQGKQALAMV
jgi:diketogulonate reductase-like aldo/keto reductase